MIMTRKKKCTRRESVKYKVTVLRYVPMCIIVCPVRHVTFLRGINVDVLRIIWPMLLLLMPWRVIVMSRRKSTIQRMIQWGVLKYLKSFATYKVC